eukprot:2898757-Rhodomonas_salina.1
MAVSDEVDVDVTYVNPLNLGKDSADSSMSNIGLIAGCAAGGAVLVGLLGFLAMRLMRSQAEDEVAEAPSMHDLKAQLTMQGSGERNRLGSAFNLFTSKKGAVASSAMFERPVLDSQGDHSDAIALHSRRLPSHPSINVTCHRIYAEAQPLNPRRLGPRAKGEAGTLHSVNFAARFGRYFVSLDGNGDQRNPNYTTMILPFNIYSPFLRWEAKSGPDFASQQEHL